MTGCTAGGWATTFMARSPLSDGGVGLAGPLPPPVEPVVPDVPEPDFEPPLDEAPLLGLMLLNIDEPVSVPSTEVRLPAELSAEEAKVGAGGVLTTTRLPLSTLT